jgi:hypothetical protein
VGIVVLIILFSVISNIMEKSESPSAAKWKEIFDKYSNTVVGTLFFLLAFPIIPVALRAFVWMQRKVSNGDLPFVTLIQRNECTITYVIWGIIVIFIVVMLPEIIKDIQGDV